MIYIAQNATGSKLISLVLHIGDSQTAFGYCVKIASSSYAKKAAANQLQSATNRDQQLNRMYA